MIKKKTKKKTGKKATQRRAKPKSKEVSLNPSGVRKEIAAKVEAEADKLAAAVIEEGKKGQLATVKYLFEVAHIYPESSDGADCPENGESLASTLLKKLGVPEEPVIHELYERGEDIVIAPLCGAPEEGEVKKPVADPEVKPDLVAAE